MKTFQAIRGLLPLIKLYPWAIPAIVVLGILSSLSEGFGISLFIPLLQSVQQTDASSGNFFLGSIHQLFSGIPDESRFVFIAGFIFVCILLKSILTYSNTVLFAWLNSQISHRLRSNIFNQLLSVSYSYLERNDTGKFINTLATETWQTSRALSIFVNLIIDSCTVLVFAVFLLLISWQLTIWVSIAIVLISITIQIVTRQVKSIGQAAVQANQSLADRMWEGLGGMRVIRAFGRERYEQQRFDRASERVRRSFFKLEMLSGIVSPLSETLSAALLLLILVIALRANQTALPTLLTFVFILYRLQPKVKQIDAARVALASLMSSVAEVMALLDRADKPYLISGHIPFQGLEREIWFRGVSFHYNAHEPSAVQNISLCIPQGKTTAFVGPSGAGKSTLISLLCRFFDPTIGEIYIDGCPLKQLRLEAWRDRLAIVSQDIYMFSTTIRENIAYGRLDATDDEIITAAQLANADEFIRQLPSGYDTHIGDRGVRLSGGQRQRIALARAIIRDPEILILDEATNALDSIAEDLIQEALKTLSRNRTVIVIAHRLSTIEQADQIIVLNQGQVVEQGNLQQLLEHRGLFTQLYQLQNRQK
ncbi:ABC transporter ATP-binding protein [Leptolyngbya sp. NIES-2104]|uniref:ABC transporter ATP-binding protein n=1 Tax=Leptolyngbya sp. NIES-2104 TaxID=1552121 RepID=UPI0006EC794B|nr:ABC transporter ATP-binding protein [Leptolyngbya sp. NIES-2104]GAP96216.1 lipid A export ATP-binding/permease protein MsbA [Leptolyngbya sp. NIES-2104]